MLNSDFAIYMLGSAMVIAVIILAVILVIKMERIKRLESEGYALRRSLDEMDEQAKLIVRTDIELNKTQEELDKKITGLYALQRLSRAMSSSLEEEGVFKIIDAGFLEDLGFEKTCGFLWSSKDAKFSLHINIGYFPDEIEQIKSFVESHKDTYLDLIKKEKVISSLSLREDPHLRETINNIFKVRYFVTAPILPKEGDKGFLFAGTEDAEVTLTEGDEELITIFSNQIGQSLENARLFEKTWHAHQELEKKVVERTHELTLALDEVEKVSKRKTDFVSSVSHELRTPLTSIKGYASILLTGKLGELPQEVRERLERINRNSDELMHMINDLLDISRIESGRVTMKQEPQDLKVLTEKIAELLSVQLKEKQVELKIAFPAKTPNIFVDRNQIERVFINLIGNAIKFTPAGGKITVTGHPADKQIEVDITDTGCGIPEEAQEHLFEEFYRVDNPINEQVKGTGLGLSLVKHIVEAHGGKIWFKSKAGEGTTFSFTLPQQA
jgi:signal transduction histidine kinase